MTRWQEAHDKRRLPGHWSCVRGELRAGPGCLDRSPAKVKWTAAGVCPLQFLALGMTEGGRSPTGDTSSARRKIHAAAARGDGVK